MSRTLGAHQVNFCPWKPFFQKIEQCDVFILLTQCQWEKGGFQNRFNVGDKWYTMSTARGLEPLRDKVYVSPWTDWCKIISNFRELSVFSQHITPNLCQCNLDIIKHACKLLGINTHIGPDAFMPPDLTGTARLINLCKTFGADRYLSGISGKNYLDLSMFEREGIEVIFQDESKMDKRPLYAVL